MSKLVPDIVLNEVMVVYEMEACLRLETLLKTFHEKLARLGYSQLIAGVTNKGVQKHTSLPATVVLKSNIRPREARDQIKSVAQFCGLVLTKCIAAEITEWAAMPAKARPEIKTDHGNTGATPFFVQTSSTGS